LHAEMPCKVPFEGGSSEVQGRQLELGG